MSDPIYVIGHRNPDTDAICAAIGYASYLRLVREDEVIAACCGEINARTNWVLRLAGAEAPKLLLDVRPTAAIVCRRDVLTASSDETFLSVYRKMLENNFRSIPVVNADHKLIGMPTIQEMAQLFLPSESNHKAANREVRTSVKNMVIALGGTLIGDTTQVEAVEDLILVVAASSEETSRDRAKQFPPRQLVLVTGDRPEIHTLALELGVRCLVVTGGFMPQESLLQEAKEKGICVIVAPQDTASASQLIRFSRPIGEAAHEYLSFTSRTPLREIIHVVQNSHQPLFPVIDEETGSLQGVFSKSDLVEVPRTKLVLVDHNEFSQAVAGADEAEIIEVIDHHRLSGNLRTKEPVRFINEPVGSTSTIVGIMYRMRSMTPDKSTAICLCAGLISDTLNLTSPTTTNTDREILAWLAGVGGIDAAQFVKDFFAAGSLLREATPARAIEGDRKVFEENGWRISISQIEEMGLDEFWKKQAELHAALVSLCAAHNLHFACLMVTDITAHHSVLLVAGDKRVETAIDVDYHERSPQIYDMPGVVSRKKQLFPYLSNLVGKLTPP
ncbi:manganese-dependent inorganic pyrophosphatase [Prosthecobacter fusiformis]|uniref:inorganic diphosphatase n=1 Tax=Prosthecobacter fusiformis TaxID=48464 RepID=A0A4V3FED4_9BACT|nr:putative manganese-dependent inorganic diphosphatase [Prosthecobacter fusiformis]TDU66493.1 manganese-dependent inorganic pyrophosphatase [Prosthecobacter fusiformis]